MAEIYELHNNLKAAPSQRRLLMHNEDVKATLFEAHLWGIHATGGDDAIPKLKTFISKLFSPVLAYQREAFRASAQARTVGVDGFEDWVSKLNLWSQRKGAFIE